MSQGELYDEPRLVFQVSELVGELRQTLLDGFGDVWVEGEIGSLHRSRPGHVYFDLKDDAALLRGVLFRGDARRLEVEPEEGMLVRVRGRLDVYAERGTLQLIARSLEPAGVGALRAAFERLRARLEAEGLFAAGAKRPLPPFPRRVGLVTSKGGAALHDFLRGLQRRAVPVDVVLCDARVQGEGAWREVVRGLSLLEADPSIEVIVLARGGGSLEDLWTFNREEVVRAIFEARTPVVSAIGHEVDVVLSDLVADVRAATPTAAASVVVPDGSELRRHLSALERRVLQRHASALREWSHRVDALRRGLVHPAERLDGLARRLGEARTRLGRGARDGLARRAERLGPVPRRLGRATREIAERRAGRLAAVSGRLEALSPLGVLGRGYAIVRSEPDGRILTSSDQTSAGEDLRIRLADGGLRARVVERLDEA